MAIINDLLSLFVFIGTIGTLVTFKGTWQTLNQKQKIYLGLLLTAEIIIAVIQLFTGFGGGLNESNTHPKGRFGY